MDEEGVLTAKLYQYVSAVGVQRASLVFQKSKLNSIRSLLESTFAVFIEPSNQFLHVRDFVVTQDGTTHRMPVYFKDYTNRIDSGIITQARVSMRQVILHSSAAGSQVIQQGLAIDAAAYDNEISALMEQYINELFNLYDAATTDGMRSHWGGYIGQAWAMMELSALGGDVLFADMQTDILVGAAVSLFDTPGLDDVKLGHLLSCVQEMPSTGHGPDLIGTLNGQTVIGESKGIFAKDGVFDWSQTKKTDAGWELSEPWLNTADDSSGWKLILNQNYQAAAEAIDRVLDGDEEYIPYVFLVRLNAVTPFAIGQTQAFNEWYAAIRPSTDEIPHVFLIHIANPFFPILR